MQRIHKTLAICLLVTALVFGVLKILGGIGMGADGRGDGEASSRDSMTRHERGEGASDSSTRKLRQRARKLTSAEAAEFLKTTIIPEINFENITLKDALKIVNKEIAKQTPDDQPRPRILLDADYPISPIGMLLDDGSIVETVPFMFDELRLRKVPANVLLKYMCDYSRASYWFYKGDYYLGGKDPSSSYYNFYHEEKLNRVKLDNIDASQLASRLEEIIEQHDYYGFKSGISIYTTEKARAALLKGEVQLPRINLNMKNVTLDEVIKTISEHTDGALSLGYQCLSFNPLGEEQYSDDPFVAADQATKNKSSFDVIVDENIFKPKTVLLIQDPLPSE